MNIQFNPDKLKGLNASRFYRAVFGTCCCDEMKETVGHGIDFRSHDGRWSVGIVWYEYFPENDVSDYFYPIRFCPFCGEEIVTTEEKQGA